MSPLAAHLVRRGLGSLWPAGPSAADTAWVASVLNDGERALWNRLGRVDRRHAVGVARRVAAALGPDAARPVLAAALLHDVGKLESGLGVVGRVAATVAGLLRRGRGGDSRIARYLAHPDLGARLLEAAGSDPLTVVWTREHHLPPGRWTLPPALAATLKVADDD